MNSYTCETSAFRFCRDHVTVQSDYPTTWSSAIRLRHQRHWDGYPDDTSSGLAAIEAASNGIFPSFERKVPNVRNVDFTIQEGGNSC